MWRGGGRKRGGTRVILKLAKLICAVNDWWVYVRVNDWWVYVRVNDWWVYVWVNDWWVYVSVNDSPGSK